MVKSFRMRCLCLCLYQSLFAPSPPLPLGGSCEYLTSFHWGAQCFGAWWVPLTGLSWLPSRSLTASSVFSGIIPTPSIDDGFKTTKTNKEKEPYLSNVFQFGTSRCFLLYEQNTVPRRPLFVLIPPYKNQVKQVFVSAEHALAIRNVFHKIA